MENKQKVFHYTYGNVLDQLFPWRHSSQIGQSEKLIALPKYLEIKPKAKSKNYQLLRKRNILFLNKFGRVFIDTHLNRN